MSQCFRMYIVLKYIHVQRLSARQTFSSCLENLKIQMFLRKLVLCLSNDRKKKDFENKRWRIAKRKICVK